jgi:hypothetical protein
VPDGADGGVCGCERTIIRRCQRIVSQDCGAVDLLPQDVLFAGIVGSTGRDACPVIEGHRLAGGGGLASITTTRREGTRRTR